MKTEDLGEGIGPECELCQVIGELVLSGRILRHERESNCSLWMNEKEGFMVAINTTFSSHSKSMIDGKETRTKLIGDNYEQKCSN